MAVLLTGGTGKNSTRISHSLLEAKIPFVITSRKGQAGAPEGVQAVKFDWLDASTYENPFQHEFPGGEKINAVFLVQPEVFDPETSMNAFIDYAVEKHSVKRFVLLTGSMMEQGGPLMGKVWQHLIDAGVEWCVLRCTWFMENFIEKFHPITIKQENKIYTCCGDGKIPFVSADDIAAVAFRALTDEKPHNTNHRVLGPELLTYDQVAEKIGDAAGRKIEHVHLSEEESCQRYAKLGMPQHLAQFLSHIEALCAQGCEERSGDDVEKVTGRPPQNFDTWVQKYKTVWQ